MGKDAQEDYIMWYGVHKADGELVSIGSVVAPDNVLAAKGLFKVPLGEVAPDQRTHRWDAGTRQFVLRVVKDRLDDLVTADQFAELRTVWQGMSAAQKLAVRNALITLLGPARYRQDDEPVTLG